MVPIVTEGTASMCDCAATATASHALAAATKMVTTPALMTPLVVLAKWLTYAAAEVQKLFTHLPFHSFRQSVYCVSTKSQRPHHSEQRTRGRDAETAAMGNTLPHPAPLAAPVPATERGVMTRVVEIEGGPEGEMEGGPSGPPSSPWCKSGTAC